MPDVMTYASLQTDVQRTLNRDDATLIAMIPRFIMYAEQEIATEIATLGFERHLTDTFLVGSPGAIVAKPSLWRETISINVGTGTGFNTRSPLYERSYEFCRTFWPDPTETGIPRFYADMGYQHWLFVPSPDLERPFEVVVRVRDTPLSDAQQVNYTTTYLPQLLFWAALMQSAPYLKDDPRLAIWESRYEKAKSAVTTEDFRRVTDRTALGDPGG